MKNREEFLSELSELSRRYRIIIGGCGCCGSPFLMSAEDDEQEGDYIVKGDRNRKLKWKVATDGADDADEGGEDEDE